MFKVGIIGDGYTAAELIRLAAGHDEIEIVYVSSTDNIGRKITELYPQLLPFCNLICQPTDLQLIKQKCDAVFLALPHGLSVPYVKDLVAAGIKCVDLGADFRLKDASIYEEYYKMPHEAPEMLSEAIYGIPELYREDIKNSQIVANPGCFPTGAIMPLAPLLQAGIIEADKIIIDSKTGVSGAGRGLRSSSHFCEVNEGIKAYGLGTHRHGPEIEQELSIAAGKEVDITFTPHLVPMNRGILTTSYSYLCSGVKAEQVRNVLEEKYKNEYFVQVLDEGLVPHTKWVYGNNFIYIGLYVDEKKGKLILVSALDNLNKGASGQALQNLNLIMGIEETKGLRFAGVNP